MYLGQHIITCGYAFKTKTSIVFTTPSGQTMKCFITVLRGRRWVKIKDFTAAVVCNHQHTYHLST